MLMTNKVKEHNGFYFLLTEIQLCALIFFEMEYIPQGILNKKNKSINIFRTQFRNML